MSRIKLGKITQIYPQHATAELEGRCVDVCVTLVPDLEVGDRVVIHKGFVLKRLEDPSATSEPPLHHPDEPAD